MYQILQEGEGMPNFDFSCTCKFDQNFRFKRSNRAKNSLQERFFTFFSSNFVNLHFHQVACPGTGAQSCRHGGEAYHTVETFCDCEEKTTILELPNGFFIKCW